MKSNNIPPVFEDMRMMTFKRWNLPQTEKIFKKRNDANIKLGDYVSYSTYHFIDIQKIIGADNSSVLLEYAYKQINENRKISHDKLLDIHTVQSMMLIGPKTEFWKLEANQLFITLVQLSSPCLEQFSQIQVQIGDLLKGYEPIEEGTRPEFALYYSLDFCDLVLFVKNIRYDDLHNLFWQLTLIRADSFISIRDTYTICSFGWQYLKECFSAFDQMSPKNVPNKWNDRISFSVNLSIQSLESLEKLEASMKSEMDVVVHRLPGRNDVNLSVSSATGTQALLALYEIDKLCVPELDETFGGYEVVFQSGPWKGTTHAQNSKFDSNLLIAATAAINKLCEENARWESDAATYLYETRTSLVELFKNGFADEFLLSVLPSFLAYLKIKLQCASLPAGIQLENNSLDEMRRNYYTALNTLMLCTMHNERQFIQAPAFNALYFEIPPKLLAFYSAVCYDIAQKLSDTNHGEKPYRFIIAPDYRKDIYVMPLQIEGNFDTDEHLAVINLCEKYFYEPAKAIMLIAHETGHFVGDRKRKERVKLILKAISLKLLANTYLSAILSRKNSKITSADLIDVFADMLADYLIGQINRSMKKTRNIDYLLSDIKLFLEDNNYGLDFFAEESFRLEISSMWRKRLYCYFEDSEFSSSYNEQILRGLSLLQKAIGSDYLTQNPVSYPSKNYIDVFVRLITTQLADLYYARSQDITHYHADTCRDIINSFSESYADLRMREIFGDKFNITVYRDLLLEINNNSFVNEVRSKVMDRIEMQCDNEENDSEEFLQKLQNTIVDYIMQYLDLCKDYNVVSHQAQEAFETFCKDDLYAQCALVNQSILNHRTTIIEMCKES